MFADPLISMDDAVLKIMKNDLKWTWNLQKLEIIHPPGGKKCYRFNGKVRNGWKSHKKLKNRWKPKMVS